MKRKGAPTKEGKCPRDAPKDQKCDNCRLRKGACQFAARIAAANAILSPDEPSTSERPTPQPAADFDMDDAEPRPSRERKVPERIQVDDLRSFATGKRRSTHSCYANHIDAEPSTSEPAPKPKFIGPMDKYLSDSRVEAAVKQGREEHHRQPGREEHHRQSGRLGERAARLRPDGRTGGRRARRWSKEKEAIQKKLDRVTKELDKVKMEAAREIGNLNDAEDHRGHPQGDGRQSVSA